MKTPCGVISAFLADRTAEENSEMHGELLNLLLKNGFAPTEARGEWDGLPELCWVVPGISEGELVGLAWEFGQDAVAYHDGIEPKLIRP